MKPRMLMQVFAFLFALAFPTCARAQFGVYGEFNGAIDGSSYQDATNMYGATVGGYFNLVRVGPLVPGLDVRGTFLHGAACCGNNFHINSFLAGPRLTFRVKKGRLKPYAEFLVGVGSAAASYDGAVTGTGFAYQPTGGVDVALIPRFDWRLIEVSYERGPGQNDVSNAQTGILSTGIVFHF
ncbi:MAG: hypothetical protein V4587_02000 [Acidobacteriota bacterium]